MPSEIHHEERGCEDTSNEGGQTIHPSAPLSTVKLGGFEWFTRMGAPRHVVAPMVDHSFLAFRTLCRRYGAHLCYTPMLHSRNFVIDHTYRSHFFTTDEADRPLVVQFCGNEPDTLLTAARLVEGRCDAVDINFGCPQNIAKRGNYGSFLMHHPELVRTLVSTLHKGLAVPVFCKMRIFSNVEDTIAFALMLQDAGCQLLTVHGRTKEQKGQHQGLADWDQIKAIKSRLHIPVVSNGNIRDLNDVTRCLEYTRCDAVMSAEGLLANPALFSGRPVDPFALCHEYLDICEQNKDETHFKYVRSHILKMLRPQFDLQMHMREDIHKVHDIAAVRALIDLLRDLTHEHPQPSSALALKEDRARDRLAHRSEDVLGSSIDLFAEA